MKPLSTIEAWSTRHVGTMMSGRGRHGALIVLTYHRVLAAPDPLLPDEPTVEQFAAQMDLVAGIFNVLPLSEAVRLLKAGSLPPRALCITFDDGYSNNFHLARPILARKRLPATIFVAPGFLDNGRMFNDTIIESIRRARTQLDLREAGFGIYALTDVASKRSAINEIIEALKYAGNSERDRRSHQIANIVGVALPSDLMMTEAEVREAHSGGIEIGAHTINHPILCRLDPQVAEREIVESKLRLQEITGAAVKAFAYPNGRPNEDYDARHVAMVSEAGFDLAVSTAWGAATASSDVYQLPRIAPWDRHPLKFAGRTLRAYRQRHIVTSN